MRKYKQVKKKKVTYDLDEWREVERRAAKLKMKTGTYIKRISADGNISMCDMGQIAELIKKHFDMRPAAIIRKLELNKSQYRALAAYGQMGRTALGVKWEDTDKADELRKAAGC